MSRDELKKVKVLGLAIAGVVGTTEAAESLGMTGRHFRRLKAKYIREGEEGIIHGNRGRKPSHALEESFVSDVISLYEKRYYGSNYSHYSELLERFEGVKISPSSIGRILKSAGHNPKHPVRRRRKKHQPRDRRSAAGMLWQIDATPYAWLGDEFGQFSLHAAIDDATGAVVGACFTRNECSEGYVNTMRESITRYGLPLSLYSDKHTIFRSPQEKLTIEEELDGVSVRLSNFGKAMSELGIEHIKANTPQAKGRIERLWRTLQDRLPVELRLLGVNDLVAANKVLADLIDKHNKRHAVPPATLHGAYRPLEPGMNLDYIFAKRDTRKVGCGGEVTYKRRIYVPVGDISYLESRTTVEIRETLSGEVVIWYKGRAVPLREIKHTRPVAPNTEQNKRIGTPRHNKPAADHPWRQRWQHRGKNLSESAVA